MMGGSKIIRCTCKHSFQDERYGLEMRVHTETFTKPAPNKLKHKGWRCTVCLHEIETIA